MTRRDIHDWTSYKITPDSKGNLDIESSELLKAIDLNKLIEFEFEGNSYFLNAERAARYHLRNSIIKIKNMVDLVEIEDPVAFDVGANCGIFAAILKDHCPNSQVFAFEPAIELQTVLEANCAHRGVTSFDFGIGSTNCSKTLYVNPDSHQTNSIIASNVLPFKVQKEIQKYEIQVRSVDNVVSDFQLPSPKILKVDTQGYEGHVFIGAKNTMQGIQQIFVESSWMDVDSITCLLPMARHYGFNNVCIINSVFAGADLMLSKNGFQNQTKQPMIKINDDIFDKSLF